MDYRFELNGITYKNDVQMKIAAHCAPVFAGIKPSNSVTLDKGETGALAQALKHTGIQCSLIYAGAKRCVWLLYRKQELEQYLKQREHQIFMRKCGYDSIQLNEVLAALCKNYREYKNGKKGFPHELGLILGYPLCDVKGFIRHQGSSYLFSGYWKVYGNAEDTRKRFEVYDLVRYQIMKQVQHKKPLAQIAASYSNYRIQKQY